MRQYLFILSLLMACTLCNGLHAQDKGMANEGNVIPMDHEMFIKEVFDYTNAEEWKYQGRMPAIIDLYADWCGPCRMVAPILQQLAQEYKGKIIVYKVNTDQERKLAGAVGIQSLPTILLIPAEGQPQVIVGAADKDTFKKAIETVLLKQQ